MPLDAITTSTAGCSPTCPPALRHEPILDYATDERVKARLGWQAEFSKTLFSIQGWSLRPAADPRDGRLDNKAVKAALGAKPSICTADEMQDRDWLPAGSRLPFLPRADIPLLVDPAAAGPPCLYLDPGPPRADLPAGRPPTWPDCWPDYPAT